MNITFNWGTGIFIFYCLFAGVLFFAVYKSTQRDNSLVVDNYYEKDLAYQAQFTRMANSANLSSKVQIEFMRTTKQVKLTFPPAIKTKPTGTILFYKANDKSLDWQIPLLTDTTNQMLINMAHLPTGRWKLQVHWESDGVPYYDEKLLEH